MRFLLLSPEFPPGPGGMGTHAFQLARHLVRRGWEGMVAVSQAFASEAEIEAFNYTQSFAVVRLPRVSGPQAFMRRWQIARSCIRTFDPDILIGTGDRMNYFTAGIAARFQRPWIAIDHGRVPERPELLLKRWSYRRAATVICVSEYTRDQNMANGITGRRLDVIPNGADAELFRVLPDSELAAVRSRLPRACLSLLLTVGSVTDRKGQDVVVRAMPRILERRPEAHYVCAGIPARGDQLQRLAGSLGVGRNVHLPGRVDAATLVAWMNLCDVFVMTSRHIGGEWEGYGIGAVEAALCGKPAVVSTSCGLAEAIEHGRTGLAVEPNDPDATATAILYLLDHRRRRRQMGQAARRRALAEQTWAQRATHYDVLLREIASGHRSLRQKSGAAERANAWKPL